MPRITGDAIPSALFDDAAGTPREMHASLVDITFGEGNNLIDTTTVDTDEMQREIGLHDSTFSANFLFTDDVAAAPPADTGSYHTFLTGFKTRQSRTMKLQIPTGTRANIFFNGEYQLESATLTRAADGSLVIAVSGSQAAGVASVWTNA